MFPSSSPLSVVSGRFACPRRERRAERGCDRATSAIFLCHKTAVSGVIEGVTLEADGERVLVERLRRGDRHAFRELYARYAQQTFRFLTRLCGRHDQAEDLHQETWLA